MTPRLGVALGSGGARGIVHISYIEAIEELGLEPAIIAGTSMGALLGAGWASGMRGSDLREYVTRVVTPRELAGRLWLSGARRSRNRPQPATRHRGRGRELPADTAPETFAGLKVPLIAVATDYFRGEQAVFSSGPLLAAVAASLAIPGVFRPVASATTSISTAAPPTRCRPITPGRPPTGGAPSTSTASSTTSRRAPALRARSMSAAAPCRS